MSLLALYPVFAAREVDPDVVLRVKTLGRGCLASGLQLGFSRLEMDLCCYIPKFRAQGSEILCVHVFMHVLLFDNMPQVVERLGFCSVS